MFDICLMGMYYLSWCGHLMHKISLAFRHINHQDKIQVEENRFHKEDKQNPEKTEQDAISVWKIPFYLKTELQKKTVIRFLTRILFEGIEIDCYEFLLINNSISSINHWQPHVTYYIIKKSKQILANQFLDVFLHKIMKD